MYNSFIVSYLLSKGFNEKQKQILAGLFTLVGFHKATPAHKYSLTSWLTASPIS